MLSLLRYARWTLSLGFLTLLVSNTAAQGKIEYNRDVRPILTENCFQCHGPAAKKGGVRLDSREDGTKTGKRGTTPIVPGKLDMSEMVKRIFTTVGGEMMPPPSSHKKLTAAQKETLKQWIAQGAEYQKHWSFEAPVKLATPKAPGLPSMNPIDGFIADRNIVRLLVRRA